MRVVASYLSLAVALTGCSSGDRGPDAPDVEAVDTVCAAGFCIDYPATWEVEVGETFVTFAHPLDPSTVLASVGPMDMRGIVEADGGTWPTSPQNATRAFWRLIAGGEAVLEDLYDVGEGVRSEGRLEGMRLWHLLAPVRGADAIGVEVRAPNPSWASHAEVFLSGLTLNPR